MRIGNNIKKLRELKNYTQSYMADQLNLSTGGYGKIERGEIDLTIGRLEKIAHVLDTDLNTIINFNSSGLFRSDEDQKSPDQKTDRSTLNEYLEKLNNEIRYIQAEIRKIRSSL